MTKFKCNGPDFKAHLDKIYDHLYPDVHCWISMYSIGKGNPFKVSAEGGKMSLDKGSDFMDGILDKGLGCFQGPSRKHTINVL